MGESSEDSVIETTRTPCFLEQRLEDDSVLAVTGEARILPDEDELDWRPLTPGLRDHPLELGAVRCAPARNLIHELPDDAEVVLCSVLPQGPELRGYRKVYVLPFAGYTGVEGDARMSVAVVLAH